jgi:hypothetical protein
MRASDLFLTKTGPSLSTLMKAEFQQYSPISHDWLHSLSIGQDSNNHRSNYLHFAMISIIRTPKAPVHREPSRRSSSLPRLSNHAFALDVDSNDLYEEMTESEPDSPVLSSPALLMYTETPRRRVRRSDSLPPSSKLETVLHHLKDDVRHNVIWAESPLADVMEVLRCHPKTMFPATLQNLSDFVADIFVDSFCDEIRISAAQERDDSGLPPSYAAKRPVYIATESIWLYLFRTMRFAPHALEGEVLQDTNIPMISDGLASQLASIHDRAKISLHPLSALFWEVEPKEVVVPTFDTAGDSPCQKVQVFVKRASECLPRIQPYESDYANGACLLFHGTRLSNFMGFRRQGIFPPAYPNELCRTRAFYTTNSLALAYAHPLFLHTRPGGGSVPDPVVVLVFKVDYAVLHGAVPPSPDAACLTSERFRYPDDEDELPEVTLFVFYRCRT